MGAESPEGASTPNRESTSVAGEIGVKDAVPRNELAPDEPTRTALKRFYGQGLLWLMWIQLVVVNGVFLAYAWAGYDFRPPERTVQVWLVATFVEIVSVVVIITRSLFPPERDTGPSDDGEAK